MRKSRTVPDNYFFDKNVKGSKAAAESAKEKCCSARMCRFG